MSVVTIAEPQITEDLIRIDIAVVTKDTIGTNYSMTITDAGDRVRCWVQDCDSCLDSFTLDPNEEQNEFSVLVDELTGLGQTSMPVPTQDHDAAAMVAAAWITSARYHWK